MNKAFRFLSGLFAIVLCCTMLFMLAGCNNSKKPGSNPNNTNNNTVTDTKTHQNPIYDKEGNEIPQPSDNDEEGWFSVEVANQFAVPSFTQPDNTKVVTKPQRNELYLKGDKNAFKNTVLYAFQAVRINDAVYLPELGKGEDGIAKVTALNKITYIDSNTLFPTGDITSINLIYKAGHKAYECAVSYDINTEQVYIALNDRTELYYDLM